MDRKSYKGITRSDINQIRSGLLKYGIKIPESDDAEVKGPLGVKMQFTYDEPIKTLHLTIIEKPAYIPQSQIWKLIEATAVKHAP